MELQDEHLIKAKKYWDKLAISERKLNFPMILSNILGYDWDSLRLEEQEYIAIMILFKISKEIK